MAVSVLAFGDFALRTPDVLFLGIKFSNFFEFALFYLANWFLIQLEWLIGNKF